MAQTSFGKILTVLDLFSLSRSVINVDIISEELKLSKPTSYRYLKELVSAEILQRLSGTSGDYTLGSKIAVLDYISRQTDPLLKISVPFLKKITQRTEFSCILTHLNYDSCIDLHDEVFQDTQLLTYGRGCPRPIYVGSSAKVILAHLPKQQLLDYYQRYSKQFEDVGFADNVDEFLIKIKKIKKQGYHFSNGELEPNIAALSVPIKFSSKEPPLSLSLIASKNRFEFVNIEKLVLILQENAVRIEQSYQQSENTLLND